MNGEGTLISVDGAKTEGNFCDGLVNGYAKQTLVSGEFYEGNFLNGKRHGQGKCIWPCGDVYEGEWAFNYLHGSGTMSYNNGDLFEGLWKKDGKIGRGKLTRKDGTVLNGEWTANESGTGSITYSLNDPYSKSYSYSNYEGCWFDHIPNGWGKMILSNGVEYSGEWVDGVRDGTGEAIFPSGDTYKGSWHKGLQQGFGIFKFTNGIFFTGQFMKGKYNGKGKMCWPNGQQYIGEYVDNQQDGLGIMLYSSGFFREGLWKNGEFLDAEYLNLHDSSKDTVIESYKNIVTADDMCRIANAYLCYVKKRSFSMLTSDWTRKAIDILQIFVTQATSMAVESLRQSIAILSNNGYSKEGLRSGDKSLYRLSSLCITFSDFIKSKLDELDEI